jgi:methylenetetrahydrofolate dehydrogenase (NADP+)/methenyltetrahydrofolate cyclohydrolase
MILLDGKKVSELKKQELTKRVKQLGYKPSIAILQVGNDLRSSKYINYKIKMAKAIGVKSCYIQLRPYISQHDLEVLMHKLAKDDKINGIIVQLPIPSFFNQERILNIIPRHKDIDGLIEVGEEYLNNGE